MFTRRTFLGSLMASLIPPGGKAGFQIGVSDAALMGQMKPKETEPSSLAMQGVFEIPGMPQAQFQTGTASQLAKRLQHQEIHLAIMTGIEFGWNRTEYPELLPLVIAYVTDIRVKACLLAPADSKAKDIIDLKGQSCIFPQRLQHHPFVYLHQEIVEAGGVPKGFFDRTPGASDTDDGIEKVLAKEAPAILVDADSWNVFQERKPGRARKIKVLDQSNAFPTTAILYHPAKWKEKDIAVHKRALCTAHERPFSRQILNFCGIKEFVPYTTDYQNVVNTIVREIPQPVTIAPVDYEKRVPGQERKKT